MPVNIGQVFGLDVSLVGVSIVPLNSVALKIHSALREDEPSNQQRLPGPRDTDPRESEVERAKRAQRRRRCECNARSLFYKK